MPSLYKSQGLNSPQHQSKPVRKGCLIMLPMVAQNCVGAQMEILGVEGMAKGSGKEHRRAVAPCFGTISLV